MFQLYLCMIQKSSRENVIRSDSIQFRSCPRPSLNPNSVSSCKFYIDCMRCHFVASCTASIKSYQFITISFQLQVDSIGRVTHHTNRHCTDPRVELEISQLTFPTFVNMLSYLITSLLPSETLFDKVAVNAAILVTGRLSLSAIIHYIVLDFH